MISRPTQNLNTSDQLLNRMAPFNREIMSLVVRHINSSRAATETAATETAAADQDPVSSGNQGIKPPSNTVVATVACIAILGVIFLFFIYRGLERALRARDRPQPQGHVYGQDNAGSYPLNTLSSGRTYERRPMPHFENDASDSWSSRASTVAPPSPAVIHTRPRVVLPPPACK